MSNSNAASSAQTLLDALIELRRRGPVGVFSDSGRFRAFMLDLRPGLKKEVRVLSALIDTGMLKLLQEADVSGRVVVAAQIKNWLAEEMMLSADNAFYFSDVLLAFYNGKSLVSAVVPSAQPGSGSAHTGQSQLSPQNFKLSASSGCTADECIAKGARLYAKGRYREAADWYRKAAALNDADAQYMLGNMYRDGVGVDSDWDRAVEWYCRAVAQGHAEAKQALFSRAAAPPEQAVPKTAVPPKPAVQSPHSASSLRCVYANKRVGECFEFGRYPQGKNGEVMPITWRVLRQEKDYLLVIAERGLDCKPYHTSNTSVTWADCSLRRWLNVDFYDRAFSMQERKCFLKTSISNNAGPATEDRVFLLSAAAAERFFANYNARLAKPTAFAVKKGVYTYNGCCRWWLRSRGCNDSFAADVYLDGGVDDDGSYVNYGISAVRPAFKIAL